MHRYEDGTPHWARPPGSWDDVRPPIPSSSMRVSDAERAEVTNALCRHFGDGRLDEAELNERLARAAAAKTRGDLAPLLIDLPRFDAPAPAVVPRPRRHGAWLFVALFVLAVLALQVVGTAVRIARFQVPWVLVAILVLVFLRRGHHRHPHHHH